MTVIDYSKMGNKKVVGNSGGIAETFIKLQQQQQQQQFQICLFVLNKNLQHVRRHT